MEQSPAGSADTQRLSLDDATTHLLEECRMVLPGIQALFGFQLIAVFSARFASDLTNGEQRLHLIAIALTVISIALVMTPAALHRQALPMEVTTTFIRTSSALLLWTMPSLAIGLCVEVYIVARLLVGSRPFAVSLAVALAALFAVLWFAFPRIFRRRLWTSRSA